MGQSKNVMSDFMKKNKPTGTSFQDGMLKLVRTLPKVPPTLNPNPNPSPFARCPRCSPAPPLPPSSASSASPLLLASPARLLFCLLRLQLRSAPSPLSPYPAGAQVPAR